MPASSESSHRAVSGKLRVYVPVTVAMLRELVTERELRAVNDTAFAVTPALREAYASGDDEELAEVAMGEAARASLRLLADDRAADELHGTGDDGDAAGGSGATDDAGDVAARTDDTGDSADTDGGDDAEAVLDPATADGPAPTDVSHRPVYRRAVVAADVEGATLRPDLDDAVVRLSGPITWNRVASVHLDLVEAEPAVAKAVDVIDAADMGDPDAEFVLGDAEDHQLAWYATQELPFLLDLL
ncbi:Uncharacterised protein [Nocardia otitidiscaviarum]|uniref:Uncharacterized protein n=1 Tax=Nocardia otitidiscaviarum TaxID=1823 RepID=A0A378Y8V3_9NOCA|nr:hypothetical protein [Nocardia otitidiscaviarum]SUA72980.1 Uncharacterised protein [Nocardia otitidiscaviarum]